MVKIRIHELAKELGKNSREVIDFLKTKNIEAANHMSTLTEEEAAMVRKGLTGKGSGEVHKKTKAAIVYRPQNSSQPIPRRKPAKPEHPSASETKAEKKEVKKNQEHVAETPMTGNASGEDTGREKVRNEAVKKEMVNTAVKESAVQTESVQNGSVRKEETENTRSILPQRKVCMNLWEPKPPSRSPITSGAAYRTSRWAKCIQPFVPMTSPTARQSRMIHSTLS